MINKNLLLICLIIKKSKLNEQLKMNSSIKIVNELNIINIKIKELLNYV